MIEIIKENVMELKNQICEISQKYDSFYLYDEKIIKNSISNLRKVFSEIEFLYSIKCNSNVNVLKSIFSEGFGADAASLAEVLMARKLDLDKNKIYYSAPGKISKDIEIAINESNLIADSIEEIRRINMVSKSLNKVTEIGVRLNPDFSGKASKFGVDEDIFYDFLQNNSCQNIKIIGIHVHLKSQELNVETLANYYKNMFLLVEKVQNTLSYKLKYVNMGSGMGIQYSKSDVPLDLDKLKNLVKDNLNEFKKHNPDITIFIETGRYVTAKSGFYIMKVLDKKVSYGTTYLILKNTLNGFIKPSVIKLVSKYEKENPVSWEPLFTSKDAFEILTFKEETDKKEKVTLVGNLCTATDVIAEDIVLPSMDCGDIILINNAGSYAAVLSPMQFSSQEKPVEVFLSVDGSIKIN